MNTHTTTNPGYGFHGEIANGPMIGKEINRLFCLAAATLLTERIATSQAEAIEFLDSRMGRHLGDAAWNAESDEQLVEIIKAKGPEHMRHFRREQGSRRANSK